MTQGRSLRVYHWRFLPLVAVLALFAGCAGSPTAARAPRLPAATAATAISGIPSFSGWRVAYIGPEGHVRAVSLDGKADVALAATPASTSGTGAWTAGAAPGGRSLAFSDTGEVFTLDASAGHAAAFQTVHLVGGADTARLFWSPDGTRIAVDGGLRNISIITLASGAATRVPIPTQPQSSSSESEVGAVYGWLDATHLAVNHLPGETAPVTTPSRAPAPQVAASLDSLDITSGALRPIVTVRASDMVSGDFSLAPDGSAALFFDTQTAGEAAPPNASLFQPLADRVDIITGAITPLPHIAGLMAQAHQVYDSIYQVLWIPGTRKALVTLAMGSQVVGNDIIDIDADTVTPVLLAGFPVAWSPGGATLVVSSVPHNGDGEGGPGVSGASGPFILTAITYNASWSVTATATLTARAMLLPTLGFIHTA